MVCTVWEALLRVRKYVDISIFQVRRILILAHIGIGIFTIS